MAESAFGRLLPGELLDVAGAQSAPNQPLHIVVIAGNNAVNMLDRNTAVQPVVRVVDKNNLPAAGAEVTFRLPNEGAGGVFGDGSHTLIARTDQAGRASVTGMKPAGFGAFKITVSVTFQGEFATESVFETNYPNLAVAMASGAPGSSKTQQLASTGARPAGLSMKAKAGLIAGIAAAAMVGVVVALNTGAATRRPPLSRPQASAWLALHRPARRIRANPDVQES